MAQMIKGNYNALMWLQDELQQSLTHALNAMRRLVLRERRGGHRGEGEEEGETLDHGALLLA